MKTPYLGILVLAAVAGPAWGQLSYVTFQAGARVGGVAAADFNGDGRTDVVFGNGSGGVSVLLNDGKGGFGATVVATLGTAAPVVPQSITAADFNGDGKMDVLVTAVSSGPTVPGVGAVVMLGRGDGSFQAPVAVGTCNAVTSVRVADFNGDGVPDIAMSCLTLGFLVPTGANLSVLLGKGDGTFQAPSAAVSFLGLTPWAVIAVGDFNGDGKADIAAVTGFTLLVMLNDGKGGFTPVLSPVRQPWNFAPGIAAGDFNGDGKLDLVVTGQSLNDPAAGTISILLGSGDGTFLAATAGPATLGDGQIVAMDLNGDGKLDLVEGLAGPTFFAGRGDGSFDNGRMFAGLNGSTGIAQAPAVADFTATGMAGFAQVAESFASDGTVAAGSLVVLPKAVWPVPGSANVSSAGFGLGPLAAGSLATFFGSGFGANPTVEVDDAAGVGRAAVVTYGSDTQINYVIPAGTAAGLGSAVVSSGGRVVTSGLIAVVGVAPGLFTVNAVNSTNLAAAYLVRVGADGGQKIEPVFQADASGGVTAVAVDLSSATDTVILALFGTGIRNYKNSVTATFNGSAIAVSYAGTQGSFEGLDQMNLVLPKFSYTTAGSAGVQVFVDGQPSNVVTLLVQ